MSAFQLDTSGYVQNLAATGVDQLGWHDLSPFVQGYVEAMFTAPHPRSATGIPLGEILSAAFSDLAPETMARIREDCARFLALRLGEDDVEHGRRFWRMRVTPQIGGGWHPDFPPITITLGDDGKVRFQ